MLPSFTFTIDVEATRSWKMDEVKRVQYTHRQVHSVASVTKIFSMQASEWECQATLNLPK